MPSLGLYVKNWRTIPLYRAESVGAFPIDNTQWDPERWKPRYGNSAFRSARLDDKFWAARRLQAVTDEMLNALIGVGQESCWCPCGNDYSKGIVVSTG